MWFLRAQRNKTVLSFDYMDIGHQGYHSYQVAENVTLWRFTFTHDFQTQPVVKGILDHAGWRRQDYTGMEFAQGRVEHDKNIGSCAIESRDSFGMSLTEYRSAKNQVFDWLESNFPGVTFYIYDDDAYGVTMHEYRSEHM